MGETSEKQVKRDDHGRVIEGTPNPNGRPKGQRNYATIYREALIKLAELNDKTPEDLENELVANGLKLARKGDYRFYKDMLDRLHGTAVQNSDVKSGGKPIESNVIKLVDFTDDSGSKQ